MSRPFTWKRGLESLGKGGMQGLTNYLDLIVKEKQQDILTRKLKEKYPDLEPTGYQVGGVTFGRPETSKGTLADLKLGIAQKIQNPKAYGMPTTRELKIYYPPTSFERMTNLDRFYSGFMEQLQKVYDEGKEVPINIEDVMTDKPESTFNKVKKFLGIGVKKDKVKVRDEAGNEYWLPKEQLEKAEEQGYRLIE